MKPDCPVREVTNPKVKKENSPVKEKDKSEFEEVAVEGTKVTILSPSPSAAPPTEQVNGELVKEAVQLLRSLRPRTKAVKVSSMREGSGERALLDGGATHVLRSARSMEEFQDAVPIQVELAAGEVTLRQDPATGTLLTEGYLTIIPLGRIARLGYKILWQHEEFELRESRGVEIPVEPELGCPTVAQEVATEPIERLEKEGTEMQRRLKARRAGEPGEVNSKVWRWMVDIKELWPDLSDEMIARIVPSGQWEGAALPWNRRQRKKVLSSHRALVLWAGSELVEEDDGDLIPGHAVRRSGGEQRPGLVAGEVCEGGAVDALLGGPPCRTVSKLRHQRPGPPVLRARHGPERFALDCLSEADRELALNDATLWFRQLWLFSLAQGARKEKVRFLKEHP